MMRGPVVVIDNYDSFTYNLVQYVGELGRPVQVFRNDAISVEGVLALQPRAILISPGPGRPEDAGITLPLVVRAAGRVPVLGVCLGHQAIGAAFGARIGSAPRLMHGKSSSVRHDGRTIFQGMSNPLRAGRYHSLCIEPGSVPPELEVSAFDDEDGTIMGVRHRRFLVEGVQFHPESVLTPDGRQLLQNFLELAERAGADPAPMPAEPAGTVGTGPSPCGADARGGGL